MNEVAGAPGRVLIGGVGYRWMRDGSFGVVVSDLLSELEWLPHVEVADLGYGAILVAQDLMYAKPRYSRLVLVASMQRGREPGSLHSYRWTRSNVAESEIQARIHEAGGGVIELDHLLIVADYLSVLPEDVVIFELEPVDTGFGEHLSHAAARHQESILDRVRREALRPPCAPSALPAAAHTITDAERRIEWSIRLS